MLAADWSAALLPVVVLLALWSAEAAGAAAAAAPLVVSEEEVDVEAAGGCALWSPLMLLLEELEAALLSRGTVLDEAGAVLVPVWLFAFELELLMSLLELWGVVAEEPAADELGAVCDGAAVGFAWLEVWSLTAGEVEVLLELAGAVLEGEAAFWFDVAEEFD